jgi:transposase
MVAVGIDVSKGKSAVAAVGEGKKLLQKPFEVAHNKTDLSDLVSFVKKFDDVHVVMEHTGVYYRIVAETLYKAGVRVSAVNPVLINQFGNNTLRKVKTDKKDAMKIARYAIENRADLRDYTMADTIRDNLKTLVRQFNLADKSLWSHYNSFLSLLERVFPGIDGHFSSPAKANGHQKLVDFVLAFWHNDCISLVSETKFLEKYSQFCKKNRYCVSVSEAKEIHRMSRQNLTTMPKDEMTKMIVTGAAQQVLQLSIRVETLRAEMIQLAKQLPEFETVTSIYGVGEALAAKLMGEVGDVRRFESKRALVAYAGVDPDKDDSGKKVSKSGKMSRSGDALLRKAAFQAVECYLMTSPQDEPVYQFLDKKRSEGKNYFVYMTAACNKFLRVYYGRVKEYLDALDARQQAVAEGDAAPISADETQERIIAAVHPNTIFAFACGQDRATQGCDPSGLQDLAYTDEGGRLAAL